MVNMQIDKFQRREMGIVTREAFKKLRENEHSGGSKPPEDALRSATNGQQIRKEREKSGIIPQNRIQPSVRRDATRRRSVL